MKPTASIIVPVYNMEPYVADTIKSIKEQTFNDWECIVVNDGSTDNSEEVIRREIYGDCRFHYFKTDNHGVASAKNFAVSKSSGELLMPLDPDDIISPRFLANAVAFLEKHHSYSLYYGKALRFGVKKGHMKVRWKGYRNLLYKNSIFNTAVFRKEDFIRCGGYDSRFRLLEDWEMYIRLLYRNHKVRFSGETSFKYRIRSISRNRSSHKERHCIYKAVYEKNRTIYRHCLVFIPSRMIR